MKMKLTTFMFSLLLAVGWTSSAQAQALPQGGFTKSIGLPNVGVPQVNTDIVNAKNMATMPVLTLPTGESIQLSGPAQAPKRATGVSSAVHDKAYYQQYKYSWTGADGVLHENVDPTEPATDPYQIYELLRFVYTNRNFPGPLYSAYTPTYQREDPVYYGGIAGGWDIGTDYSALGDITISVSQYQYSNAVYFKSIIIMDGTEEVTKLEYADGMSGMPTGWTISGSNLAVNNDSEFWFYTTYNGSYYPSSGGTITISSDLLQGHNNVQVIVNARNGAGTNSSTYSISVNNSSKNITTNTLTDYTWNVTSTASLAPDGTYTPYEDGYTVVLVALKDRADMTLETPIEPSLDTHFETKSQLITYIQNNFEYVRLLTDGLRIGDGQGTGTVFNADGRLNRFFFLGKGQARKKAPRILERIANGGFYEGSGYNQTWVPYYDWYCEQVPFEEMFEQFSPTSGEIDDASQTLDLFDKLREGNVYSVVHDCGSVMQAEHEFSLAGKDGTEHYPFSGLNFFVPDYRLLYWTGTIDVPWSSGTVTYDVDGRDMNAYENANPNYEDAGESHGDAFIPEYINWSYRSVYYAQYNMKYAPKLGIYRINLTAEATQVGTSHNPSNHNYNVTLTWVSSLNQMTGSIVPQTYTMYLIDENGNRTQLEPENVKFYDIYGNELDENNQNPFHVTQAVYAVPQNEHSYTIEYQVDGVVDQGPAFHATSNRASVVIPGWNDFVGLQLDHHESDFVISSQGQASERHNWYRNFLALVNEDIVNGLTVSKITGAGDDGVQMNEFNLYRFIYDSDGKPSTETKVATITFDQATEEQAHFTVAYQNQEIEDYTLTYKEDGNTVTVDDAYSRANLDIPEEGWVRVKGNGDIVIWPNGYTVNFKSIRVYNGNSTTPISGASWTAPNAFPDGWYISPGSKWENYTTEAGDQVGYVEGGGYIAIPDLLDNYPNARVVIEAYGDAGSTNRIAVNDQTQNITAAAAGTNYTWATPSPAAAPRRAGETQTITESFEDENTFPSFGLGGITATQHTGAFGEWKLYDSTGANVWGMTNLTWSNQMAPQAWMPFNGNTVNQATAHSGNKYMESICPLTTADAAESNEQNGTNYTGHDGPTDSWLISPQISGNAQTITFWAKEFVTDYGAETFEVLYSTTGNNPEDFTLAQSLEASSTDWTEYSVDLPAGAKYFAIRHTSTNVFGMMIDDVTYEISNEAPAAEGGLLRLHLLMADQLKERIPDDNSHPDAYGYVLRWEQPENKEDHKQSGTVRVNIQKTDCEVMGYYTLDQIDRDKDRGLTMDVLTADVEFNLSNSNDLLNYYNLQARADHEPTFNQDYVTKLHRQEDFTYREMLETSPNLSDVYPSGEHHYFDDSTPIKTGFYDVGDRYMSYAPSVSTWGVQRRYFEYDGLDNTYGGPIWKTAVGKAQMGLNPDDPNDAEYKPTVEFQEGWNTSWTVDGKGSNLYILDNLNAIGYLPPQDLTKVEFEPYMFRFFVESKNGMLRPFKYVTVTDGDGKSYSVITADENGSTTGPTCVWSGYVKLDSKGNVINDPDNGVTVSAVNTYGPYEYTKNKVQRTPTPEPTEENPNPERPAWDKDENNAIFGALDELLITGYDTQGKPILRDTPIPEDDLKIFVRFYFCVKGEAAGHTPGTRALGSRSGNGAESAGSAAGGVATGVHEVQYLGEIVSQTYYNVQGMVSDKPFDGVNIVVTRFGNGTTSVSKIVR